MIGLRCLPVVGFAQTKLAGKAVNALLGRTAWGAGITLRPITTFGHLTGLYLAGLEPDPAATHASKDIADAIPA